MIQQRRVKKNAETKKGEKLLMGRATTKPLVAFVVWDAWIIKGNFSAAVLVRFASVSLIDDRSRQAA